MRGMVKMVDGGQGYANVYRLGNVVVTDGYGFNSGDMTSTHSNGLTVRYTWFLVHGV